MSVLPGIRQNRERGGRNSWLLHWEASYCFAQKRCPPLVKSPSSHVEREEQMGGGREQNFPDSQEQLSRSSSQGVLYYLLGLNAGKSLGKLVSPSSPPPCSSLLSSPQLRSAKRSQLGLPPSLVAELQRLSRSSCQWTGQGHPQGAARGCPCLSAAWPVSLSHWPPCIAATLLTGCCCQSHL